MHLTRIGLLLFVTGIAEGLECSAGCNAENGLCVKPGECSCKPGWRGRTCDQCIPFPGCLHGACEKAWQCVCEEGWGGSHCDQDTRPCSSEPCAANATCVETGEGGHLCMCPSGYVGGRCHLRKGPCLTNGSPCQNGGTCVDGEGEAAYAACACPAGFTGDFCEINVDSCAPNPCLNDGNCTNHGLAFACACPPGFSGFTCNHTARTPAPPASPPPSASASPSPSASPSASPSPCLGGPCANGGTCVDLSDRTFRCACPRGFAGVLCSLQQRRPKTARPKPARPPPEHRALPLTPQHYSLSAHAFHKLLRPPERDPLKREGPREGSPPAAGGPVTRHGQLLCFSMLALLTCLVVLGTTAIVFFGRCEAWLANARYSQLVRQHREHLLREAGAPDEPETSVNIILPEKIRLASFGRHYTSI